MRTKTFRRAKDSKITVVRRWLPGGQLGGPNESVAEQPEERYWQGRSKIFAGGCKLGDLGTCVRLRVRPDMLGHVTESEPTVPTSYFYQSPFSPQPKAEMSLALIDRDSLTGLRPGIFETVGIDSRMDSRRPIAPIERLSAVRHLDFTRSATESPAKMRTRPTKL
jgi:hypothetical protein